MAEHRIVIPDVTGSPDVAISFKEENGTIMPAGNESIREVAEFNIHPNAIKSLGVGTSVVIKNTPLLGHTA